MTNSEISKDEVISKLQKDLRVNRRKSQDVGGIRTDFPSSADEAIDAARRLRKKRDSEKF